MNGEEPEPADTRSGNAVGSDARLERALPRLLVALVAAVAIVGVGLVPALRYAWGLTLWQYLAPPLTFVLGAATLLLCVPAVHRGLARAARRIPPSRSLLFAALAALTILLWVARVRLAFGDSRIIYFTMRTDPATFYFPDVGATFFLQMGARIGRATGVGDLELVQGLICLCAPLTIVMGYRAARLLADTRAQALVILGLVLGNAMLRIFAGHLEVYAFVLVTVMAYAWAALAFLAGRCPGWVPALAFGLGLWVHIQYLFLGPSLMLLYVLREPGRSFGHYFGRWLRAAPVVLAPIVGFFALLALMGFGQDLIDAVAKMVRWSDVGPTPEGHEAWIRFWGGSGGGTRYLIFSPGHLKYLANAFFMIAPFSFFVLGAFALVSPRLLFAGDRAAFLACASATALLYAIVVRPVYGPYDWDLFSLTAVFVSLLAGHLLVRELPARVYEPIGALVVGAGLLLLAIPFLIVGANPARDAGPFSRDLARPVHGEDFTESFERQVAPWL